MKPPFEVLVVGELSPMRTGAKAILSFQIDSPPSQALNCKQHYELQFIRLGRSLYQIDMIHCNFFLLKLWLFRSEHFGRK